MTENTKKKIVYRSQEEDKSKKLEFLRLYEKKKGKDFSIPDNIIQSLNLWENEKDIKYSDEVIIEENFE